MLVWLLALTVRAQLATDFIPLSRIALRANVTSPAVSTSASSESAILLAWLQDYKVLYSLVTTEGVCIQCERMLGNCRSPQIEHIPGSSAFVAACLTDTAVVVKLISAHGAIQSTDSLKSAKPIDLRLVGLSNSLVLLTYASQDPDNSGVFSHLISVNGPALGASFRVNRFTQGLQGNPLACEVQGGFVVLWESKQFRWGMYGQYFDYSGKRIGTESMIVNRTDIRPLAMLAAGQKQLILYTQCSLGSCKIWLQDLRQSATPHQVTGLPKPIWALQRAQLLAVTDDILLLGLNYKDPAGLDKSLLLAFAPAGCHFTSVSFSSFTGGLAISHMSVRNDTVLVVLSNETAPGFTLSRFTLPSASVCLSWSEPAQSFPKWSPKVNPTKSLPEVLIIVASILAGCLLLVLIALWIRYLFSSPHQLETTFVPSQGTDLSIKSLVQMEDFKLGRTL